MASLKTTTSAANTTVAKQQEGASNVRDSQGVVIGDQAVQNNDFSQHNHYHYHGPQTAQAASRQTRYVKLDLAAAFYDRKQVSSKLEFEFSDKRVSTVFLIGQLEDWHEGMWNRLQAHYQRILNAPKSCAQIEWPHDGDESKLWFETSQSFGVEQSFNSLEISKQKLSAYLTELHRKRGSTHLLIRIKFDDTCINKSCTEQIKALIDDWKQIHSQLKQAGTDDVYIDILFTVVDDISKTSLLKSLFSSKSKTKTLIESAFPEATTELLPLVSSRDIDDWVSKVRALFELEINNEDWWLELESQMRKQFASHKKDIHLKTLRDQLATDERFRQALKYPN